MERDKKALVLGGGAGSSVIHNSCVGGAKATRGIATAGGKWKIVPSASLATSGPDAGLKVCEW